MLHPKCSNRNVLVAIHNARLNLMHLHLVARRIRLLQPLASNANIFRPGPFDMRSHLFQPMRAIGLQHISSSHHPRRKNQVRISQRVVGMQMREKHNIQCCNVESLDSLALSCRRPPHNSRTTIDQIRAPIHHHGDSRPRSLRIRNRRSSPQNHHPCPRPRTGSRDLSSANATLQSKTQQQNRSRAQNPPEFLPQEPSIHSRLNLISSRPRADLDFQSHLSLLVRHLHLQRSPSYFAPSP